MPKFTFQSSELKKGFGLARVVKPETGDFCLRFTRQSLTVFSYDARRYVRVEIPCGDSDVTDDAYSSSEFYILVDRIALFDSDLDSVTFTVNEKSLGIKAFGGEQIRKASLKKRSPRSRRPSIPDPPSCDDVSTVPREGLDQLLRQVSCSAQVKETKTEEDMRVNQVHFYPSDGCAVSSARYFGSVAYMDGMSLDLSIVSSDIPAIKAFCNKVDGDAVVLGQDDKALYVMDPDTASFMSLSKVSGKKPPLRLLDDEGFDTVLVIDQERLSKSLGWAQLAIEGTQRMSFRASKDSGEEGTIELYNASQEISQLPVRFLKGSALKADFPVRFFFSMTKFVDGDVSLKYGHKDAPTILGISQHEVNGSVRSTHYLQSMRER